MLSRAFLGMADVSRSKQEELEAEGWKLTPELLAALVHRPEHRQSIGDRALVPNVGLAFVELTHLLAKRSQLFSNPGRLRCSLRFRPHCFVIG